MAKPDDNQTVEEARAELEADGVDVDTFLKRVSSAIRFFVDHGVIHDRKSGRHLTAEMEPSYPEALCAVLQEFENRLHAMERDDAGRAEGAR